ncbi:hypothetical protein [Sulfurisphaera ohwakuensis]|uniref:Uncharacterized protein n=1 Tax=Sulfurisphaera ohwakuensis TaxID=69656 RepID=A0A650CF21_SULOH|nr:hypothetical protein [Sulfurisphaera ohwakuensis]MBB5254351.1 hypothetical protein [Sulfurisphaera ohwakuensis]QGR16440.1 hypothetical protein D1869_03900 [Sulfurisphaera ohwakuensis]
MVVGSVVGLRVKLKNLNYNLSLNPLLGKLLKGGRIISKEIDIQKSVEISENLYHRVMLNAAKTILDFIGLGSLTTFLLISLVSNPITFNISILVFSTIYMFISWRMSRFVYPFIKAFNSHKSSLIVKKFPLLVKLTYTLSLLILYVLFLLSFYIHFLSNLPIFLVGAYISFIGIQLITTIRFLKENSIEYVLVTSYILSGVAIIISPFHITTLLIPPFLAFLYKLIRRAEEWS